MSDYFTPNGPITIEDIIGTYEVGQGKQMAQMINHYGVNFWKDFAQWINNQEDSNWFKFATVTVAYNAVCPHPEQLGGKHA